MMDAFDSAEQKGRQIFQTYLDQMGIQGVFTKDKYNSVDCYVKTKRKKFVAELKVRYAYYDKYMIEVDKLEALLWKKKQYNLDIAYYICFYGDTMYAWDTNTILENATEPSYEWCKKHTVLNDGYEQKWVRYIPTDKANRYDKINGVWTKV